MKVGELRALLEAHGLRPNQRFGQNFLVDPALLAAIPADAGVAAGERVLEVGPGAGALTAELLAAGARVLAVELDHGLARLLQERFRAPLAAGELELVEGDALDREERLHPRVEAWWGEGDAPRLVANLPYAISGPFLGRLPGRALAGATLLLQREVAEKACGAAADDPDGWSPLAVRLALAFEARLGRRLPPQVFWPRPQVDSAFLHLAPRAGAPDAAADARLAAVLREAFGQRRKRLLGRLGKSHPDWAAALEAAGVAADARPGAIPPETWHAALTALS